MNFADHSESEKADDDKEPAESDSLFLQGKVWEEDGVGPVQPRRGKDGVGRGGSRGGAGTGSEKRTCKLLLHPFL